MIFAREVTPGLTGLVKKIDEATAANAKAKMGSFVVVMTEDEKIEDTLKSTAKKESLKKTILTHTGSKDLLDQYPVAKDSDITVVLYTKRSPKAEYAFKKGAITEKDVEAIIADLSKILPAKK